MRLERERDFGRELCEKYGVSFAESHVAQNRLHALQILDDHPNAYVIKNPLCSPTSPVHTIICETIEDTRSWLDRLDYAEGVFLQEYLGPCEAGHIAFVSHGEIYSLVTNQEYKRAFNGNMGIIAGAPLGGLAEQDPDDKYGLARELLHPLLPWFRETDFHGPVQVTACQRDGKWTVVEYNVRLGVTCTPLILGMLERPLDTLYKVMNNKLLDISFREDRPFACSLTLAGYGYPYIQVSGPSLPVELNDSISCDLWWNEVDADKNGELFMTGHRIADFIAFGDNVEQAIAKAYDNIRKVRCLSSYYRTDVGETKWPPGMP
jgi:phosphoribosylamine-glycine ligase